LSQIRKKFCLHRFYNRKALLFISLIFVSILVSSCFVSTFSKASTFVYGSADKVVNNETELKDAVNNAPTKASIIIALDNDISLSSTLIIPANKDITLTSSKFVGFYKLIGASDRNTITIEDNGKLKIDGIIVTHASGDSGNGIYVNTDCMLIMNSGEVSGNLGVLFFSGVIVGGGGGFWSEGGGVLNRGIFEMHGGKISNNESPQGYGGGVYNNGSFTMFGGEISNNKANGYHASGGGVYIQGVFELHGGKISNNQANGNGGGAYINTYFDPNSVFRMFGGTISGNTATLHGGGVYSVQGGLWQSGTITGNTANQRGGGVFSSLGTSDFGRVIIYGNTAKDGGNDVYPEPKNEDSSNGNSDDSANGNNELPNWDSDSSSNGDNGSSINNGVFSLRDRVIVCLVTVVVVLCIIIVFLLVLFQKRIQQIEQKQNMP
jgi:hypothetical protein